MQHTSNASSIWCTSLRFTPFRVSGIAWRCGAYRAYCQDVGFFGVDPEDLRVLELDLAALTALIGRGLGIPRLISAEEILPRVLYPVGSPRFGPYRTRVYFARCLDRVGYFAQVYSALEQHRDHTPVILVSTTPWQRIHRELPARHALVSLSDVAELRGQRLKFNEDAFLTNCVARTSRSEQGASAMSSVRASVRPSLETKKYQFTKKQAEVVEVLFQAFELGLHKMHQDEVMGRVEFEPAHRSTVPGSSSLRPPHIGG